MKRHSHLVPAVPRILHRAAVGGICSRRRAQAELGAETRRASSAHFAEEERDLLPLARNRATMALAERLACRARAAQGPLFAAALQGRDEAAAGQALIDHVRFEERELFPAIESCLVVAPLRPMSSPEASASAANTRIA